MIQSKYIIGILLVTVALGIAYFYLSPESNIFTGSILDNKPKLNITISPSIIPNDETSSVLFIVSNNGLPISGATINVDGAGIDLNGKTNIAGQLKLQLTPTSVGKISVVASKSEFSNGISTILSKLSSGNI